MGKRRRGEISSMSHSRQQATLVSSQLGDAFLPSLQRAPIVEETDGCDQLHEFREANTQMEETNGCDQMHGLRKTNSPIVEDVDGCGQLHGLRETNSPLVEDVDGCNQLLGLCGTHSDGAHEQRTESTPPSNGGA